MERTFLMVKPDGVQRNLIGEIVSRFESKGYQLVGAKLMNISQELAEQHYGEHKERPFFGELVTFMTSGPVLLMALTGENAVLRNREIMGATDPAKADAGTIRKQFGSNIERNAIHGSDAPETAAFEIGYFFNQLEVV